MSRILVSIIGLSFSLASYGQNTNLDKKISLQDSILLQGFWTDFKTAITTKDKFGLASLCEFSFYCKPCIDDTTLNPNDHISIKVTRRLFIENQYKIFLDKGIAQAVNKYRHNEIDVFQVAFDDQNKQKGFMFSYTIVAPSKKWEGLQGFVYINKIKGKYKITGIDTVP